MAGDNTREFKRVLRRHEELVEANNNAILVINSKVAELEHILRHKNREPKRERKKERDCCNVHICTNYI
jgi:hypothetical protein